MHHRTVLTILVSGAFHSSVAQHTAPLTGIEPDSTAGTSKAVIADNFSLVHTTQILPVDQHGQIVPGGLSNQTQQVLASFRAVLGNARCDEEMEAKLNIYISTSNAIPDLATWSSGPRNSPGSNASTQTTHLCVRNGGHKSST